MFLGPNILRYLRTLLLHQGPGSTPMAYSLEDQAPVQNLISNARTVPLKLSIPYSLRLPKSWDIAHKAVFSNPIKPHMVSPVDLTLSTTELLTKTLPPPKPQPQQTSTPRTSQTSVDRFLWVVMCIQNRNPTVDS